MIKAVVFDMDGLMIDSERVTYECYRAYLNSLGLDMTEDFYKTLLGQTINVCRDKFLRQYGKDYPYDECIKRVHEMVDGRFRTEGVPLKNGLLELLKYLKKNKFKTIVATSSERKRVNVILKRGKIWEYFDDSICGDEVENGKPDPEVFLKACRKLKISTEEAMVLEDSEAGIQAAYDGKIKVICVPDMKYPADNYVGMTTRICKDLAEVKKYIEQCCQ